MYNFIEQRTTSDCAIAAIAMFAGYPYEDVLEAAGDLYTEDGTKNIAKVLINLGFKDANPWRNQENGNGREFKTIWMNDAINPKFVMNLMWGREVMLSVPSLNVEDGWHMIYYDGHEVLDPNPQSRKRYQPDDLLKLEPREIYVWQNYRD